MKNKVLTLETNKYAIKLDNFEGPLDLLCYLIDKNKMDIYDVNISEITEQYIEYLKEMEAMNLDIASEFLVMASTLLYIKSKTLLPKHDDEDEAEITEEELLRRIIEYKKYKEISKKLKQNYLIFSKRCYKVPENIQVPKKVLDENFDIQVIIDKYSSLIKRNKEKINENAINIEKIAITDTYTISSKVKEIYKELIKKHKFVFNKKFSLKERPKAEVVTAFSGVLELSRREKINTEQEKTFGDITVSKKEKNK